MYLLRRIPKALIVTVSLSTALGYFLYHAEHGKYGFRASEEIGERVVALEQDLATLQAEQERLEHMVSLLRAESLDPDMLDERARADLGYAHPLELIIVDRQ